MIAHKGIIIYFTGLPKSGKTTLAGCLARKLDAAGARTQLLTDHYFDSQYKAFGINCIDQNYSILMISKTAQILKEFGIICIVDVNAPAKEMRTMFYSETQALEIFVDTPPEICRNREIKDIHAPVLRNGVRSDFIIATKDMIFTNPDIHLYPHREKTEKSIHECYNYLVTRGYIDELQEVESFNYKPNHFEKIIGKFPFPSLNLLRTLARKSIKWAISNFIDDCLQFLKLKNYSYKHRIIFIAALPKSGSTWLENMLGMVPGYKNRPIYDPSRSNIFHDVTPILFDLLPTYAYSVVKLHTKYKYDNFKTIIDKVNKFVVLYRDLRDMCVSRYYHVLYEEDHRHHELYNKLSREDALLHCVNIINIEYSDWVKDWHAIACQNPDKILEVKYEELNRNPSDTMKQVIAFFDIRYDENIINRMSETQLKSSVDLKRMLKGGDTKRKGIVGDWKNHFDEKHKDYFKQIAGDLLIDLGYEDNKSW